MWALSRIFPTSRHWTTKVVSGCDGAIPRLLAGTLIAANGWKLIRKVGKQMVERVPVGPPAILIQRNVEARMRDGTILRADVYRPEGSGPFPVLLMRVPYGKAKAQSQVYAHPLWYAERGYMVVIQDTRGRGHSDGEFYPFLNEMDDGYDSVEWAAGLPAANGRVGMYGFSYVGATQLLAAVMKPPHLSCIAPGMTGSQYYDGWMYRGGALSLAFVVSWTLRLAADDAVKRGDVDRARSLKEAQANPGRYFGYSPLSDIPVLDEESAPYFRDWLSHSTYDDYWKRWSVDALYDRITVPTLHFGGWYDMFKDGTIKNFAGLRDAGQLNQVTNRLVIGPWYHMPWISSLNDQSFGPDAANDVDELQLGWFDKWLNDERDEGGEKLPVSAFVMGRNTWEDYNDWPPPGVTQMQMYLGGTGRANSLDGNGVLSLDPPIADSHDVYVYDPATPVPSAGGHSCCIPVHTPMGPKDQRAVELQSQVLVYDSDPLVAELLVSGPVRVHLWVASSASDTDFVAKLVDVSPDGKAINICEGILRMSFRDGLEHPRPIRPWVVYEIEVDLGHTCNAFAADHRVRLEVTSSCFPQWARNLNGDSQGLIGSPAQMETATQLVFREPNRASSLVLPIMPP